MQIAEPDPPAAVEVIGIGQRNISINVTDTDRPNGYIEGYRFHIMYKLYPDEMAYRVNTDFLHKMISNIYVIERHIYPGTHLNILLSSATVYFGLEMSTHRLSAIFFKNNICRKRVTCIKKNQ